MFNNILNIVNNMKINKNKPLIVIFIAAVSVLVLGILLLRESFHPVRTEFPESEDMLLNAYLYPEDLISAADGIDREGNIENYKEMCKAGKYVSFYYSFLMANKYDYAPACYEVYRLMMELFENYHIMMDSASSFMAQTFLVRGASLGDSSCLAELKRMNKTQER